MRNKFDFNEILNKYLDGDFAVFACGESAPNENEVKDFEKKIGYRLPDDFREFSKSSLGGLYVEVKEDIWPRAKVYDVGPFWSFLYGLYVFGFAEDIPEWMDINKKFEEFQTDTGTQYTPFLKIIGDADVYCFNENGDIIRWNHETDELEAVNKSFTSLLDYELSELRKRKDKKKLERNK